MADSPAPIAQGPITSDPVFLSALAATARLQAELAYSRSRPEDDLVAKALCNLNQEED